MLPRQAKDTTTWRAHRWSSPVLDAISMAALCLSVAVLIAQMLPDAVEDRPRQTDPSEYG